MTESENILISVITVSYNAVNTIEQTILSVINQNYKNIEYIIIDGGSTDGTIDIIKKYQNKISYWVSEPDEGLYDAMNKGILKATGKIIGIINADDWYEDNALENIKNLFKIGKYIYYGNMNIILDNKIINRTKVSSNLDSLKKDMIIPHPSIFVNKDVYNSIGLFNLKYKIAADWNFVLKCYIEGIYFIKTNHILANFRLGGVSSKISLSFLKELHIIRKDRKVYKFIDFIYIKQIIKYLLIKIKILKKF